MKNIRYRAECLTCGWQSDAEPSATKVTAAAKRHNNTSTHGDILAVPLWDVFANADQETGNQ